MNLNTQSSDIRMFYTRFPSTEYKKKDILLNPSDRINYIYYVESGYIRMYNIMPEGKELTLNIFKPGTYFPLFLVLDDIENTYYYQAMSPGVIRRAPKQEVLGFVTSHEEILFDFTRRLSRGFHGLLTSIQYQLYGSVHRKIRSTIILLGKRFGKKTEQGISIQIPLTHQDIADLTGIARETTSQELSLLNKSGIIRHAHRTLTILNVEQLEKGLLMEDSMSF